jgi:amino-acid N-acetyltransferase
VISNKEAYNKHMTTQEDYVDWFRAAAPYIHAFRHRTFVIAFGGECVTDGRFIDIVHDLNLLESLGVQLVLVHGARPQIEERLKERGVVPRMVNDRRVTDHDALRCVVEAAGAVCLEIEAVLSRAVADSPMAGSGIRVASGNFITARPIGVVDGVDFHHTGTVRKVDAVGLQRRLEDNEMVVLPPLGYSPTGEIFNLTLEDVATSAAIALNAEKLIFLCESSGAVDGTGSVVPEISVSGAEQLLKDHPDQSEDVRLFLPCAAKACRAGVARTHLISRHVDGALIQELFTREGVGTMVRPDIPDVLRAATPDDVPGLIRLIEPLEADGILVRRDRDLLAKEIDRFWVLEYRGEIIGSVALYPFTEEGSAELACLAINNDHRNYGRGDTLLRHVEYQARQRGIRRLFLLSTRTGQWFEERGFNETSLDQLPQKKQELYNYERRSKIFVKELSGKVSAHVPVAPNVSRVGGHQHR